MTEISHSFEKAYELVSRNIEASGSRARLPGVKVSRYINTCTPGVLDLRDLADADRMEFLQMACYGLRGELPDQTFMQKWQSRTDLSEWAYRRAVMDFLMNDPRVLAGDRVIKNNIYMEDDAEKVSARRSIRQRIVAAGFRLGRRLPLGIKAPLKKVVMKLLWRQV